MARMLPSVDPAAIVHGSERSVYVALRDQLGDEYTVLHSYPWLRPDRDRVNRPLVEGEADFVLLHAQRGILVLEVKGGELATRGRDWVRKVGAGEEPIRNPFEQGRRNMHALLDAIEERTAGSIERRDLTHGYAAVFPHCRYEGDVPNDGDPGIIISAGDLPNMGRAIARAHDRWRRHDRGLSRERLRTVLDALMPRFRVIRALAPEIGAVNRRIVELTENQKLVFESLHTNRRLLVEGVAGSGKTVLAVERALSFAREGIRPLFLCYNKELAAWIRERLAADPDDRALAERIEVVHFHSLVAQLARDAGIGFNVPADPVAAARFWDEEAAEVLESAAAALFMGSSPPYGALIVDEAQDFHELWWYPILDLIEGGLDAPMYVFMDLAQSLRETAGSPPFDFPARFRLTVNCRNTRRIARTGANLVPLVAKTLSGAPRGVEPRLVRAASQSQQAALSVNEVRRLIETEHLSPTQIAMIGPAAKENGSLAAVEAIAGVPLTTSAAEWRRGRAVLCTTARSFKGLEADVVVLYDLGGTGPRFSDADLYVACTRAKALLVIVTHDDGMRRRLEAALSQGREHDDA